MILLISRETPVHEESLETGNPQGNPWDIHDMGILRNRDSQENPRYGELPPRWDIPRQENIQDWEVQGIPRTENP